MAQIDWVERWKRLVADRATLASGHADSGYWDRRARSYAASTHGRSDEFLQVLEPYLSPSKTLIDVGAGTGRHATPLAERLEWVTAVEPSEGMRARLAGDAGPRLPKFSELFMLLLQVGVAPDVDFIRYPIVTRYASMEEALTDCRALFGDGWDEAKATQILDQLLRREGDELVFDGGVALSGVAHWRPQRT